MLVISLESLHSAKHIYRPDWRDRLSAESEVGGNSCIRDILHCAADKVSGSELFLENIFMQIKTNKHHCV